MLTRDPALLDEINESIQSQRYKSNPVKLLILVGKHIEQGGPLTNIPKNFINKL